MGHLLDFWLLTYWQRSTYMDRYCNHYPRHGWRTNLDTDYAWALGEAFANTYAWAFHNIGAPGYAHGFPYEDRNWFINWILSLPIPEIIWI